MRLFGQVDPVAWATAFGMVVTSIVGIVTLLRQKGLKGDVHAVKATAKDTRVELNRKVDKIHILVNSKLTEALAQIIDLKDRLGIEVTQEERDYIQHRREADFVSGPEEPQP